MMSCLRAVSASCQLASRIVELFGYAPTDQSDRAISARRRTRCPFLGETCTKRLRDGARSGVCTSELTNSDTPVICCPMRLYADEYRVLRDVAAIAFGPGIPLVRAGDVEPGVGECIAVFGQRWGKELRLPSRGSGGAYSVDWVLAHLGGSGDLVDFVAVEVQSIDTTGNYRAERQAYLDHRTFEGNSTAGFNWENVNKRILPQLIYKGHVLRQEPLCSRGLFFVCPTPVYAKIRERLGGDLRSYPIQPGSLTVLWYGLAGPAGAGEERQLVKDGELTTTVDQVALAFTAPSNLPPPMSYETAIRAALTI